MGANSKIYGVADKAWQVVTGCSPKMPCAERCWARRTVARVVSCQGDKARDVFKIALTPDGSKWSGNVQLDTAHLLDPMKWKKPVRIATGFHGDWGRLSPEDIATVLAVMSQCPEHQFMPLTKCPGDIATLLAWDFVEDEIDAAGSRLGWCHANAAGRIPLGNVSIGCSVMYQSGAFGADQMREPMRKISELGWRTHVWYEPAISRVNWNGWEFIEQLIMGGESGNAARSSNLEWYRDSIVWCRDNGVAPWMKQLGRHPIDGAFHYFCENDPRKGEDMADWPRSLCVREYPETRS